jgi:hypothetical protein
VQGRYDQVSGVPASQRRSCFFKSIRLHCESNRWWLSRGSRARKLFEKRAGVGGEALSAWGAMGGCRIPQTRSTADTY